MDRKFAILAATGASITVGDVGGEHSHHFCARAHQHHRFLEALHHATGVERSGVATLVKHRAIHVFAHIEHSHVLIIAIVLAIALAKHFVDQTRGGFHIAFARSENFCDIFFARLLHSDSFGIESAARHFHILLHHHHIAICLAHGALFQALSERRIFQRLKHDFFIDNHIFLSTVLVHFAHQFHTHSQAIHKALISGVGLHHHIQTLKKFVNVHAASLFAHKRNRHTEIFAVGLAQRILLGFKFSLSGSRSRPVAQSSHRHDSKPYLFHCLKYLF